MALTKQRNSAVCQQDWRSGMNGAAFFCFGAGRGGAGDIFFSEGILYFIVYIQCCVGCAAVDDIVV